MNVCRSYNQLNVITTIALMLLHLSAVILKIYCFSLRREYRLYIVLEGIMTLGITLMSKKIS